MSNPNQKDQNIQALMTPMLLSLRDGDSTCMSAYVWLKFFVIWVIRVSYHRCQLDIDNKFHCVFIQNRVLVCFHDVSFRTSNKRASIQHSGIYGYWKCSGRRQ